MTTAPKLWSLQALAVELARDVRTVSKALRRVPPDGKLGKHDAWYMATAAQALTPVERRFRERPSSNSEPLYADLKRISADLHDNIAKLELEPDIERRREAIKGFGHLVGDLDRALAATMTSEEEQLIYGPFRDRVVGSAMRRIMELCEWTLAPEAA